jgi:hypothetical protein
MSAPWGTLRGMGDAAKVIHWNGTDLPPELASVPPGDYRIEPVDRTDDEPGDDLPPETQARIRAGMASIAAGKGIPLTEVDARLRATIAAARAR